MLVECFEKERSWGSFFQIQTNDLHTKTANGVGNRLRVSQSTTIESMKIKDGVVMNMCSHTDQLPDVSLIYSTRSIVMLRSYRHRLLWKSVDVSFLLVSAIQFAIEWPSMGHSSVDP